MLLNLTFEISFGSPVQIALNFHLPFASIVFVFARQVPRLAPLASGVSNVIWT